METGIIEPAKAASNEAEAQGTVKNIRVDTELKIRGAGFANFRLPLDEGKRECHAQGRNHVTRSEAHLPASKLRSRG